MAACSKGLHSVTQDKSCRPTFLILGYEVTLYEDDPLNSYCLRAAAEASGYHEPKWSWEVP